MPATVKITIPEFLGQPLAPPALMREVGELAVRMIRERTRAGQDAHDRPFTAYTPAYAARRQKEGHGTSPVTLTVSGRMLNDLAVINATEGKATLGFRSTGGTAPTGKGLTLIQRSRGVGAETKAIAHDRDGVGASRTIRKFMGLTPAQIGTIRDRVVRYLAAHVRR